MSNARLSHATLIIFCIAFLLQCIRTLLPLAIFQPGMWYDTTSESGIAAQILLVFCGGFFGYVLLRWSGIRTALLITAGGLITFRLALQLIGDAYAMMWLASAAVFCGWAALPLLLSVRRDEEQSLDMPLALIVGVALDAAIGAAWGSWDPVWQRDAASTILIVMLGVVALAALHVTVRAEATPWQRNAPVMLLATAFYLSLQATLLANPAKMATLADMSVFVAGMLPAVFSIVGIALANSLKQRPISRPMLLLTAVAVGMLLLFVRLFESTLLLGVILLVAQTLVVMLLLRVFGSELSKKSSLVAYGSMSLVFGLLTVIINFLGSIIRLPVNLLIAPAVCLILLALLAPAHLTARAHWERPPLKYLLLFGLLALIPLAVGLQVPTPVISTPVESSLRIMTYNIHQGIDNDGIVGLEAIAMTIEAEDVDIVLLQEVSRGIIVNGSTDSFEWLARRLRMEGRFYAADRQFGNAILTHLPIRESDNGLLPRNQEMGQRTYIRALLDVGNGEALTVISTHFDHQLPDNRMTQVERILEVWGGEPQTIIGGDFNATPGTDEIASLRNAGLVSGQDAIGNAALNTFIAFDPFIRIDYVMGSPDVRFISSDVPRSLASDHLPVVVEIALPLTDR